MNTGESLAEFLGWCSVINLGFLVFSALLVTLMRRPIARLHGKMFGLGEAELSRSYFSFLAHYEIAVIVFNVVPYLALQITR